MEIQGKITHILPMQSGNGWNKYGYVLQTQGEYPKSIAFDVFKRDYELQIGDTVTAQINIESREHNAKWYTAVKAYKINKQGGQAPAPRPALEDEVDDDLPF
jgi:hypothetical protein